MRIGIICAMEEEMSAIWSALSLSLRDEVNKAGSVFRVYGYEAHELIMVMCGIGKVNAALTTQMLLDNYSPDAVINVGVAGSLSNDLSFGDVVIASDLVEHDVDTTVFGDKLGQIPRMDTFSFSCDNDLNQQLTSNLTMPTGKIVVGRIVSGDQFIDSSEKANFLAQEFSAIACEMEGAAIAHTCYVNKVPVAVIRSLSDKAGHDGESGARSFNELKFMAAERSALVIKNFLGNL